MGRGTEGRWGDEVQMVAYLGGTSPRRGWGASRLYRPLSRSFLFSIFKSCVEVWLLYKVEITSAAQQSDSVLHIHVSILLPILFPRGLSQRTGWRSLVLYHRSPRTVHSLDNGAHLPLVFLKTLLHLQPLSCPALSKEETQEELKRKLKLKAVLWVPWDAEVYIFK